MRVTKPVSARRTGSGSVVQLGAPGGGRGVLSGNNSSCGFGGRRRGRGMAISLMAIAKAYPCALHSLTCYWSIGQRVGEKRAQFREGGCRRLWCRCASHRRASPDVQHPERYLLCRASRLAAEAAASRDPVAAADHFVDMNRLLEPGMPAVGNDRVIAACFGPMGFVSWGCTTPSTVTARSAS